MSNGQENNTGLNQGVNYMDQPQQPVTPVQQPVMPAQQPVMPAQQPIVNTDALKAQAGNVVNTAKTGVNAYVDKLKTNKGVLIGTIVGAVLVVVLLVVVGSKLLNPSYNVVNKYMGIMKNGKAEKIVKLYHEDLIEALYDGDEDELIESVEEDLEEMEDEDTKVLSYKIREYEKYSEDELEELADYMDEYLDIDSKDVKAARKYFVRVNLDEDGEKNINYMTVTVVKIKNKWSLIMD